MTDTYAAQFRSMLSAQVARLEHSHDGLSFDRMEQARISEYRNNPGLLERVKRTARMEGFTRGTLGQSSFECHNYLDHPETQQAYIEGWRLGIERYVEKIRGEIESVKTKQPDDKRAIQLAEYIDRFIKADLKLYQYISEQYKLELPAYNHGWYKTAWHGSALFIASHADTVFDKLRKERDKQARNLRQVISHRKIERSFSDIISEAMKKVQALK